MPKRCASVGKEHSYNRGTTTWQRAWLSIYGRGSCGVYALLAVGFSVERAAYCLLRLFDWLEHDRSSTEGPLMSGLEIASSEKEYPMSSARIVALVLPIACLAGCAAEDGRFTLPAGNAERGQAAFVKFRCFDCHQVHGVDLPPSEEPDQVVVKLGGEVSREESYADLVTGIINPSHRLAAGYDPELVAHDGKSRMTVYNDVMTVSQLIDIVTFLQERYELRDYEPTMYPEYTVMP